MEPYDGITAVVDEREAAVREHAQGGGFRADTISRVATMIDATTGE